MHPEQNSPIFEDLAPLPYGAKRQASTSEFLFKAYEEGRAISPKMVMQAKRYAKKGLETYFAAHPDCSARAALAATLETAASDYFCEEFIAELAVYIMQEYKLLKYGETFVYNENG